MNCPICVQHAADLGQPSRARWRGPDGEVYCSLHFINRFGHGEPLVRVEGYKPPAKSKPAQPKKKSAKANQQEAINA